MHQSAVVHAQKHHRNRVETESRKRGFCSGLCGTPTHSQRKVKDIVLYGVFMVFFSYSSSSEWFNSDRWYYAHNVKEQFTGVEFLEHHSPTLGKTFEDIATVEEWYQWMQGPLLVSTHNLLHI